MKSPQSNSPKSNVAQLPSPRQTYQNLIASGQLSFDGSQQQALLALQQ